MSLKALPRDAAVSRFENSAPWSSTRAAPGVDHKLPHPRKQDAGVVWIHGQIAAACILVDEKRFLPSFPAVRGAKHSTLRLRAIRRPERACENDVRIARINNHVGDAAGVFQAHVRP